MDAVVLEGHGGIEVMALRRVPDPEPGPEDVLVDVVATALNRADLLQRAGLYPPPGPPPLHEIPGLEFAGRVAALGPRVTEWTVGDGVMGILSGGGYASRAVINQRQAIPIPRGMDVADAAAIPEVWLTAWDALVLQGGLGPGGVALVHGGASGVGTAAIQIARGADADVVVTCSAGKIERCLALGAIAAVDYRDGDVLGTVRQVSEGRGADVVLDVVGGENLDLNLDALALRGCIVQVGAMGQSTATIALGKLMMKRAALIGTVLRARPLEEKVALARQFTRELIPGFELGRFKPVIDRRFPLAEIGAAHEYLASNASVGKVLIDVQP
jgi:putative PIG3 family NAD(P)H quinone oxidoreductase